MLFRALEHIASAKETSASRRGVVHLAELRSGAFYSKRARNSSALQFDRDLKLFELDGILIPTALQQRVFGLL